MNSMESVTASSGCVGRTRTGGCARPLISKNVSYFNFNEEKFAYPSTSCCSCGFCWEGSAARGCVQSYLQPGDVPRLTCSQGTAMPKSPRCCHGCDKNISFHIQPKAGGSPKASKGKGKDVSNCVPEGRGSRNPWNPPRGVSHLSELPAKPGQEPKVN